MVSNQQRSAKCVMRVTIIPSLFSLISLIYQTSGKLISRVRSHLFSYSAVEGQCSHILYFQTTEWKISDTGGFIVWTSWYNASSNYSYSLFMSTTTLYPIIFHPAIRPHRIYISIHNYMLTIHAVEHCLAQVHMGYF